MLIPAFDFETEQTKGLIMGILSAIAYSLRNLIIKKRIQKINGSLLMFYQMGITIIILLPVFIIYPLENFVSQIPNLLILGFVTTAIGLSLIHISEPTRPY